MAYVVILVDGRGDDESDTGPQTEEDGSRRRT